jgi:DNA-binding beta-propeller fold protein YncE
MRTVGAGFRTVCYDTRSLKPTRSFYVSSTSLPALAADPEGNRLFLATDNGLSVSAVDAGTGQTLASRPVPYPTSHLTVTRGQRLLLVRQPDGVLVFDARSMDLRASFRTPLLASHHIVCDGWLNRAFAVTLRNELIVLDLAVGKTRRIAALWSPHLTPLAPPPRAALDDSRHRLFLLQPWPHRRLLVYDARSLKRLKTIALPDDVQAIACDRVTGRVYLTALDPARILVLDGASGRMTEQQTRHVRAEPWEAFFDARARRLFVRSARTNDIVAYQASRTR